MKKDKEGVTQVPAESENTNHAAYARSEFASPPSKKSLSQDGEKVNNDYISKEANSQEENASFFDGNFKKSTPKINPDEVIEGIWEDSPKRDKNIVEKGQLESVEKTKENGIIEKTKVLTLDDLTKDVLKTKPLYSPVPERWIKNGGIIEIANDGNWIYTNTDGISVKYVDGYPDFKGAGLVIQEVDVGEFVSREADKKKAKELVQQNPNTEWHHPANSNKLQEIDAKIHKQFTHIGAISKNKKGD